MQCDFCGSFDEPGNRCHTCNSIVPLYKNWKVVNIFLDIEDNVIFDFKNKYEAQNIFEGQKHAYNIRAVFMYDNNGTLCNHWVRNYN